MDPSANQQTLSRHNLYKVVADTLMLLCVVTGPVARFARQIAGQGYICAAPSSYHEFTGPEPLKYDAEDTDKGNAWKIGKVRFSVLLCYTHHHIDSTRIELLTRAPTETVCLRRRRQSIGRLSTLTADVQWPRWRDGNVSGWPFGVSLCSG